MRYFLSSLLLTGFCFGLFAQGTVADYQRAASMYQKYSNKVFYSGVRAEWIGDTHSFWYIQDAPEGQTYLLVNADKKARTNLFNHQKLAKALTEKLGKSAGTAAQGENAIQKEISDKHLKLERLYVSDDLNSLHFSFQGKSWIYYPKKNVLEEDMSPLRPRGYEGYWGNRDWQRQGEAVPSPDRTKQAFIRESNIFIRENGKETQISFDGTQGNYYSAYIQWSPDGKKLAAMKIRPAEQRYLYFVESSPIDQLQPKLHKTEYTKPGDALPFQEPRIFDLEKDVSIVPSTALYNQQYDLGYLQWNSDSKAITFEYNQRGHQLYRVLEISAENGDVRVLVDETSDTYVNYTRRFRYDMTNGTGMIWMSERDNWNHLYMYDRSTGDVDYQITQGEWYVREVLDVNEEKGCIEFTANGVNPSEDPYLIHYYRIGIDGKGITCLTPEEGMHQAVFSKDRKYLVDVYSKTDVPPVADLRNATDGSLVMNLEKADISALEATGWKAPETFVAKGRDGETDIWGLIFRPSNFDTSKTYPVIEYIYSGPGDQYTPKSFSAYNWNATSLAELGFIVVIMDGMTTSFRSKAFEAVCYKNLKDAGFPDRIAWIKAAAKKYAYMDTARVGIFGASAGGQEAMAAVLFHPDFYKAAYSACGCHDNRMDKIWWNELWMSYPIDEHYAANSNVENAHLLSRPLMLVVGEMDDNVDPASTMQVANALIKAHKDFELVVIPGERHTMGGRYGEHKRFDFFVKHLLKLTPPQWSELKGY